MSRKVFISVLGTGFYGKCQYAKGEFTSTPTRFVQQAMMEFHNVRSWSQDDRAYILLTNKARTDNWMPSAKTTNPTTQEEEVVKDHRLNSITREVMEYTGLSTLLAGLSTVEDVSIPDGKDEGEMWQIFSTIYNLLREGDELYIDLTHSFRYLPMLVLVLTNYAHFLKNIEVKAVSYGNFEARDKTTGIAPIVDLLPLVALQRWTFAAADFTENGNVKKLDELVTEPVRNMKKLFNLNGDEQSRNIAGNLINFIEKLKAFNDELKLCRGIKIYKSDSYKSLITSADTKQNLIAPLRPIMENIAASVKSFSKDPSTNNLIAAAKWCYEKQLYQAAVTMLQEGIVTLFCIKYGIDHCNKEKREIVNAAFIKKHFEFFPDEHADIYKPLNKEGYESKVDLIRQDAVLQDKYVIGKFSKLTNLRNDFQHCGMRSDSRSARDMKNDLKEFIDYFSPIFDQRNAPLPPLFINLSNHSSVGWSKEQLAAANHYGEVLDMEFPNVAPEAGEKDIAALADSLVEQIVKKSHDHRVTVHVMGEMCLTFAIVRRLQACGIPCISSTTRRVVEELPDGSKHAEFHFKRFRSYGE